VTCEFACTDRQTYSLVGREFLLLLLLLLLVMMMMVVVVILLVCLGKSDPPT